MAWIRVCTRSDVPPGTVRGFDAGRRAIFVANVEGRFYAGEAACPHAGCSLAEGALQESSLVCTCHGAQFDVATGTVLGGPARRPVRVLPTDARGDQLWVDA